jgi:hypothetical protein
MRFEQVASSPTASGAWLLRSPQPACRLIFVPPGGASARPEELFGEEIALIERFLQSRTPPPPLAVRPPRVEHGAPEDLRVVSWSGTIAARIRVIADPRGLDFDSFKHLFGGHLSTVPHLLLTASALLSADALSFAGMGGPFTLTEVVVDRGPGFFDEVNEYLRAEYAESFEVGHALRLRTDR